MSELIPVELVVSLLLKHDNILLICHKNPDGDTVGSAAALMHLLKNLGKTVAVLCADAFPRNYNYMQIVPFEGQFEPEYTVAIDVAGIQLFGDSISKYTQRIDLCIDHHSSNSGYADRMLLDGEAAATAELIYALALCLGTEITPLVAECLYTGVATDTGCFRFANTTAHTHTVAAQLIAAGADIIRLNNLLFENKSRRRLAVEQIALQHMAFHFDERCAITYLTKEEIAQTGADGTDLEGITGIPRAIEGVQVGITLRQQPSGSYKVSVRTEVGYDAAQICRRLGGGGHAQAAGCEVLGSLDNAMAALLAEVEKVLCTVS